MSRPRICSPSHEPIRLGLVGSSALDSPWNGSVSGLVFSGSGAVSCNRRLVVFKGQEMADGAGCCNVGIGLPSDCVLYDEGEGHMVQDHSDLFSAHSVAARRAISPRLVEDAAKVTQSLRLDLALESSSGAGDRHAAMEAIILVSGPGVGIQVRH